ncbi:MAG TPA: S1/P1 nuclease [Hansschlegelia sp.]
MTPSIARVAKVRMLGLAFALGAVLWAPACFAWGGEGHRVVAIIAQERLKPQVLAAVKELLAVEGKSDLADVANWADAVKKIERTAPVHSTRMALDHSGFDAEKLCNKPRSCATVGISAQAAILSDTSRPREARLKALKFVVHLVGDVHQPLHATADSGHERVMVGSRTTTIHKVWDTLIIRFARLDPKAMADALTARPQYRTLQYGGAPADWTVESRDIARDVIFPDLARSPKVNGVIDLPKGYAADMRPIVFDRLTQAGVRLADLLNATLGGDQAK